MVTIKLDKGGDPPIFLNSCMALCDLLSVVSTKDVATSLPQLWELCLRARDDIKVGV